MANRAWRVLVVDFDPDSLMTLSKMLQSCNYHVTTCQDAKEAISILQERNKFDIMIIDVYMPGMDGLMFVKHVCEQTDLPVVAMSADDTENTIKEGFKVGACDFLIKPVRIENVRLLWMNVYRAKKPGSVVKKVEQSLSSVTTNMVKEMNSGNYHPFSDYNNCISDVDDKNGKFGKKRKMISANDLVDNQHFNDAGKKKRVIWTPELHQKFVVAVNQFGNSKPVPKKILELMNVPGLTRENVASHLQKYRQYSKKTEQSSHQQQRSNKKKMTSSKEEHHQAIHPTHGHNNTIEGHHQIIPSPSLLVFGNETGENSISTTKNQLNDSHVAIVEGSTSNTFVYGYSSAWNMFSVENGNVKRKATEVTTTVSIGGQPCDANYAFENYYDLAYYNDPPLLYTEQLDIISNYKYM